MWLRAVAAASPHLWPSSVRTEPSDWHAGGKAGYHHSWAPKASQLCRHSLCASAHECKAGVTRGLCFGRRRRLSHLRACGSTRNPPYPASARSHCSLPFQSPLPLPPAPPPARSPPALSSTCPALAVPCSRVSYALQPENETAFAIEAADQPRILTAELPLLYVVGVYTSRPFCFLYF